MFNTEMYKKRDALEKLLVGGTVLRVDFEGVKIEKDGTLYYVTYDSDAYGGVEYRIEKGVSNDD